MLRTALLLVVLLLGACGPSSDGHDGESTLQRVLDRGELIVGLEAEFRPFEYMDEGKITGFDVDMVTLLAEELGVTLKLLNLTWTALPTELRNGNIDLIASGMTVTSERERVITFTTPYFQTGLSLLLHKPSADAVRSVSDLDDPKWTVVVKTGTTGHFTAKEMLPNADLITLPKETLCALEVAQGKAHAFVYDQFSVIENHRRHAKTTRMILEPFTVEPYAMGVRHDDLVWRDRLNEFLEKIRADGRYDEIHKKHLGEYLGAPK